MDTIRDEWGNKKRIGKCTPLYDINSMIEFEDYIIKKCNQYNLIHKYNVGVQIGGIPPKGDKTPIVNSSVHAIRYHDMLGGIMISTRNAELNCRIVDNILYGSFIDQNIIDSVILRISDKYALDGVDQKYDKIVFLPGSNIRHIVDLEKIDEILYDNSDVVIKPHPIQTEEGLKKLEELYGNHLLSSQSSGITLLSNSSMLWTTANSETGLMAALLKKPFGDITIWKFYYELLFAPIYRQFRYKRVDENYQVIAKFLSSPKSGYIAPWMNDWKERIDLYFDFIMEERNSGDVYPY